MLNLSETLDAIIQAEKIVSSPRLLDDEKITFLEGIHAQFAFDLPGLPAHVAAARGVLSRLLENERNDTTGTVGKQTKRRKDRKTEGVEEQAEVAPEGTEESSKATTGEAEGIADQTEDG